MNQLTQTSTVAWVAGAILLVFGIVNGVPWTSKEDHAKLEARVVSLQSELARAQATASEANLRVSGHDTTLAELKASIAQMNAKLDALLQRR